MTKALRTWRRSFFLRAIVWRYLLTPIGTIRREYQVAYNQKLCYLDVYIFGIRLARIHV